MTRTDRPAQRVAVVAVLLVLAAVAVQGYLPDREPPPPPRFDDDPASLLPFGVLLLAALAVIAVAVVVRLRDRRAAAAAWSDLPRSPGGGTGRASWRWVPLALAALAVSLLLMWLVNSLGPIAVVETPATEQNPVTPANQPTGRPPDVEPAATDVPVGLLAAAVAVFLLMLVAATLAGRRRPSTDPAVDVSRPTANAAPTTTESLARAAEAGLAEIENVDREPREAIIACYAAMERGLRDIPGAAPQDFDTPAEVLARAMDRQALRSAHATRLVELFEEARFSPHVMEEAHRDSAVDALRLVLDELRSPA